MIEFSNNCSILHDNDCTDDDDTNVDTDDVDCTDNDDTNDDTEDIHHQIQLQFRLVYIGLICLLQPSVFLVCVHVLSVQIPVIDRPSYRHSFGTNLQDLLIQILLAMHHHCNRLVHMHSIILIQPQLGTHHQHDIVPACNRPVMKHRHSLLTLDALQQNYLHALATQMHFSPCFIF